MTTPSALDYSALTRPVGLGTRLRAMTHDTVSVLGAVIGTLMVVVATVVLVVLVATGNASDAGGLVVLGLVLVGGLWVLAGLMVRAAGLAALQAFATANHLTLLRDRLVEHYRGSLFASGECAIRQAVRTPGSPSLEVGDRIRTSAPGRNRSNAPRAYLRVVMPDPPGRPEDVLTPELDRAMSSLLGDHHLEVSGPEVTVFGTKPLDPGTDGRVATAFAVSGDLAERCNALLTEHVAAGETPGSTPSGIPIPTLSARNTEHRRTMGPWRVVGLLLAVLVGGSLGTAVLMSVIDDSLRDHPTAVRLVVGLVVLGLTALVAWVVRLVLTPRKGKDWGQAD